MKKIKSKEKRMCIFNGCKTVLNSRNPGIVCHLHKEALLNLKVAIKVDKNMNGDGVVIWWKEEILADYLQESENFEIIEVGLACKHVETLLKITELMNKKSGRDDSEIDFTLLSSIIPTIVVKAMIKLGYKK